MICPHQAHLQSENRLAVAKGRGKRNKKEEFLWGMLKHSGTRP